MCVFQDVEREISFRTESGLYYSYYKQLVIARSFSSGILSVCASVVFSSTCTVLISDRVNSEYMTWSSAWSLERRIAWMTVLHIHHVRHDRLPLNIKTCSIESVLKTFIHQCELVILCSCRVMKPFSQYQKLASRKILFQICKTLVSCSKCISVL